MTRDTIRGNLRGVGAVIALSVGSAALANEGGEARSYLLRDGYQAFQVVVAVTLLAGAAGALAAGRLVAERPVKMFGLAAMVVGLGLSFFEPQMPPESGGIPRLAGASLYFFLAAALAVSAGVTAMREFDDARAKAVGIMLAAWPAVIYLLTEVRQDWPLSPLQPGFVVLAGAGTGVLLLADARMPSLQPVMRYSPVGPAPIYQPEDSQLMRLAAVTALLMLAVVLIGRMEFRLSEEEYMAVGRGSILLALVTSLVMGAVGEEMTVRGGAVLVAAVVLWTAISPQSDPAPVAMPAGQTLAGQLADFAAFLLAGRFGKPQDFPVRASALYATQNVVLAANAWFGRDFETSHLTAGIGAAICCGLAAMLLSALPKPKSRRAAW